MHPFYEMQAEETHWVFVSPPKTTYLQLCDGRLRKRFSDPKHTTELFTQPPKRPCVKNVGSAGWVA